MKFQLLSALVLLTGRATAVSNDASFHATSGVSSALKSVNTKHSTLKDTSVFYGVKRQDERYVTLRLTTPNAIV